MHDARRNDDDDDVNASFHGVNDEDVADMDEQMKRYLHDDAHTAAHHSNKRRRSPSPMPHHHHHAPAHHHAHAHTNTHHHTHNNERARSPAPASASVEQANEVNATPDEGYTDADGEYVEGKLEKERREQLNK